jgi:pyrimidine deaminase RibD-like protein
MFLFPSNVLFSLMKPSGGERGPESAYPNPTCAAVLVSKDGQVISDGRSDYRTDCVQACLEGAGLEITPLHEWCVKWPSSKQLRKDLKEATLYLTLEPSASRKGQAFPPITQLIGLSGIRRVVIGSPDPVPELASKGAAALHMAGINCVMGSILTEECDSLIEEYAAKANGKLARMARKHFKQFKKPLGFLHCSVVDSLDVEAYARHGNAFGRQIGGKTLSYRNLGAYEIAPPPETIWAKTNPDEEDEDIDFAEDVDDIFNLEFEDEDFQEGLDGSPMMPWYEQVDAVVATFPKPGNGPDDSIESRLSGLKWLATYGNNLPAGVERILVMDGT